MRPVTQPRPVVGQRRALGFGPAASDPSPFGDRGVLACAACAGDPTPTRLWDREEHSALGRRPRPEPLVRDGFGTLGLEPAAMLFGRRYVVRYLCLCCPSIFSCQRSAGRWKPGPEGRGFGDRQRPARSRGTGRGSRSIGWWAWVELNYRPHPYQGCALAT